jgi:sec-independent protein translocase protein TatA
MGLDNPLHIAFIVAILLLVFGARRLPEIGRSLGHGMREFKQAITGEAAQQQPTITAAQEQQQQQAPPPAPVTQPAPVVQPAPVAEPAPSEAQGEQQRPEPQHHS